MKVTVAVCAFNEGKNISRLLNALLHQELKQVKIKQIIVVSSGSTDNTNQQVMSFKNVNLLKEPERRGKVSAINLMLKASKTQIIALISADVIPAKDCIEQLVKPFINPKVGITGGRPIPLNNPKQLMGFATHVLWDLHHRVALKTPKFGECIAFRRIDNLPQSAVDEEQIAAIIKKKGFLGVYVPTAIVRNKGPNNIKDYILQRRRIYAGHLTLASKTGHYPPTMRNIRILKLILSKMNFKAPIRTGLTIMLEAIARTLGYWDYLTGKTHYIWRTSKSTK